MSEESRIPAEYSFLPLFLRIADHLWRQFKTLFTHLFINRERLMAALQ
jgi:hypothetical protein